MADPAPGHTREGLALLFFNALVAKEHPDGNYTRPYALDLLAEVLAAIDGKRSVSEATAPASGTAELEAELAAEGPVGRQDAPAPKRAETAAQSKKRSRPAKVAAPPPPAQRGRSRRG